MSHWALPSHVLLATAQQQLLRNQSPLPVQLACPQLLAGVLRQECCISLLQKFQLGHHLGSYCLWAQMIKPLCDLPEVVPILPLLLLSLHFSIKELLLQCKVFLFGCRNLP